MLSHHAPSVREIKKVEQPARLREEDEKISAAHQSRFTLHTEKKEKS
jgi:hypothetical protein